MQEPYLIELQKIGEEEIGYISVAQAAFNVPFDIKRVYWIYQTPETVERGNHAHKNTLQLLICVSGKIKITLENRQRKVVEFVLDDPNQGLFIPNYYWRKLNFFEEAICLCLSSSDYSEEDYIREYQEFLS
jgi:dTDP-4-dehydrorhamnose 3,5-epimerase-like enzyme